MIGMAEAGPCWLVSCVGLGMVSNLWVVKLLDMQQLMLYRLVLMHARKVQLCIQMLNYSYLCMLSGTSACKHVLGHTSVWGVPKIISKNIYTACQYVINVYCGRCSPDGFGRASEMSMLKVLGWKLCNPGWLVAGECGNPHIISRTDSIVIGQLRNKYRKEQEILVECVKL